MEFVMFASIGGLILVLCIAVAVFALVVWDVIGTTKERERRNRLLLEFTLEMGLEYTPGKNEEWLMQLGGFHLFTEGESRVVQNVFQLPGKEPGRVEVVFFDYSYVIGTGKSARERRQTVACLKSIYMNLPSFVLNRKEYPNRAQKKFMYREISTYGGSFSDRYHLLGENEEGIRKLFQVPLLDHYSKTEGLYTEGRGGLLVYCRTNKQFEPPELKQFMEEAQKVFSLFTEAAPKLRAEPPVIS